MGRGCRLLPGRLRRNGIHAIVGKLLYAENSFIAPPDTAQDTIRFRYIVDAQDPPAGVQGEDVPMAVIDRPGLPLPNNLRPVGNWRGLKRPPSRPMSSIRVSVVGVRRWIGSMPVPCANVFVHCIPVAIVRFGGASVR
ncbi:MAG: hypothetical protein OQK79_08220 [Rhodanobacter sp.]|nr:hypothetical protein [Rhodanobacter sp.]